MKKGFKLNLDNNFVFLLICYTVKIIIATAFIYISSDFKVSSNFIKNEDIELVTIFISAIVLAPFVETIIANYMFIKILTKFTKNTILIITISSIIFALFHCYNIIYMIYAFFSGLILNYFFLRIKQKQNNYSAIIMTTLLHFLYNLTGFIYTEIL